MDGTAGISAFIAARYDEAETRARNLLDVARQARLAVKDPQLLGRVVPGWYAWPDVEAMCEGRLAGIALKRAILADCMKATSKQTVFNADHAAYGAPYLAPHANLAFRTLCRLATEFAGHLEYKETWKP